VHAKKLYRRSILASGQKVFSLYFPQIRFNT
jgi:hypothetical protein